MIQKSANDLIQSRRKSLIAAGELLNKLAFEQENLRGGKPEQGYKRRPHLGLRIEIPNNRILTCKPGWKPPPKWKKDVPGEVLWDRTMVELLSPVKLDRPPKRVLAFIIKEDAVHLTHYYYSNWKAMIVEAYNTLNKLLTNPMQIFGEQQDHCCCCGKQLTDITSRLRGIGPECIKYFGNIEEFAETIREKHEFRSIDDEWMPLEV